MLKLKPVQKEGFYYCQEQEHPALFITMRGGKALLSIFDIVFNELLPCLICVPLTTLYGWSQDLIKFGLTKNDFTVLIGTKQQKTKILKSNITNKSFILTNKEFFQSIPEILQTVKFNSIILDESTVIKNPKAEITRFYLNNFKNFKRRIILSGDPIIKNEMDLYCQLQFLDPSILKYKTFNDFKFSCFYQLWKNEWRIKPNFRNSFYTHLSKRCFFRNIDEIRSKTGLKKFKTERIVKTFPLKPKTKEVYQKIKEYFLMSYQDKNLFGLKYVIEQLVYLRKLCSGFITLSKESKETLLIDDSKYQLLKSIILTELKNYKIIILCNFYDEIAEIEKILQQINMNYRVITGKTLSLQRGYYIQEFQETTLPVIIGNTACLKYGATLSKADVTIEVSTLFGEARNQAEKRGIDLYKDDKNFIIHLLAEKTIEEFFYSKLLQNITHKQLMIDLLVFLRTY